MYRYVRVVRAHRGVWAGRYSSARGLHRTVLKAHGHDGGGHSHALPDDLDEVASKKAQRITWIGMGSNAGLCVAKAIIGVYSGSAALVADAAHCVSDMVSDVVALFAVKIGRKPADKNQPYGYGHYETLGTLGVATLLVGGGIGSAIHSLDHLRPLLQGLTVEPVTMVPAAIGCTVVSIAVKEWLYQVTVSVGKEARSQVLIANAWHHRTDAFSSIVALGGICGAAMGFPSIDPLGGILVSGMIMKCGVDIGWEAVHNLVDAQVNESVIDKVEDIGQGLTEDGHIMGLENIRCRRLGHYVLVDLHVVVDYYLSVTAAQEAAQRVKYEIKHDLPEVAEVMVQITTKYTNVGAEPEYAATPEGGAREEAAEAAAASGDAEASAASGSGSGSGSGADQAVEGKKKKPNTLSGEQAAPTQSQLRRTHREIEADIRRVVKDVSQKNTAVVSITHVALHYNKLKVGKDSEQSIVAEVSLIMDSGITVAAAKMAALVVRDSVLQSIQDIKEVDVHMELLHDVLDKDRRHSKRHTPSKEEDVLRA